VRYDTIGVVLTEREGATFVADVLEGSPAAAAGILAGERVLARARAPIEPGVVTARMRRCPSGCCSRAPRTQRSRVVDVSPDPHPARGAVSRRGRRASARVVERAGQRIAYVHLRSWASLRFQQLLGEQLLEGTLAQADALVLDLRGGWDGATRATSRCSTRARPSSS